MSTWTGYTDTTWSVPSDAAEVEIIVEGAGGGYGCNNSNDAAAGGNGGYISGRLDVTNISSLSIEVADGGGQGYEDSGQGGSSPFQTGGTGGIGSESGSPQQAWAGGGGGGATRVRGGGNNLAIAGGGGGGGADSNDGFQRQSYGGGGGGGARGGSGGTGSSEGEDGKNANGSGYGGDGGDAGTLSSESGEPGSPGGQSAHGSLYSVSTNTGGGNSGDATVTVTVTQSLSAPSAPQNLSASSSSDTEVNLSWSAPNDWGGSTGNYNVYRGTSSGSLSLLDGSVGSASYTDSGLENAEQYFYVVTAENNVGESGDSNEVSATTHLPTPSGLTASAGAQGEIDLSWTRNDTTSDGGWAINRDGSQLATISDQTVTSYTDTGLDDGREYSYTVERTTTHRTASTGSDSATTDLPAPSALTVTVQATDQIDLDWTKEDANTGGSWEVYRSTDGSLGTVVQTITDATTTSYSDTGLTEGTEYHYTVRRVTPDTSSDSSQQSDETLPLAPTDLSATAGVGEVSLSWTDESGGEDGYRIFRGTASSPLSELDSVSANTESYTDTNATGGETYYYEVAAYNTGGESAHTSEVSETAIGTPDPPASISVTVVANDEITVEWEATPDWAGEQDHYNAEMRRDGGSWVAPAGGSEEVGADGSATYSATYTPNSGESYGSVVGIDSSFEFRVSAENSAGTSAWTTSPVHYTDPLPAADVHVERPSANEITLVATTAGSHVDGYILRYREDTGSGYGSWTIFDWITGPDETDDGNDPKIEGATWKKTFAVGQSYNYGEQLQEDARYQFRMDAQTLLPNDGSWSRTSDWTYHDYGNDGNVFFEDDFSSGDASAWDSNTIGTGGVAATIDGDFAESTPETGGAAAYMGDTGWLTKNLGDLSGKSDVYVRLTVQTASNDTPDEEGHLEWYDGSAWQRVDWWGWEYDQSGWFEVHVGIADSLLSTDSRVRIGRPSGDGADWTAFDSIVVSDMVHEYTKPTAPSGLSLDASVEDEITATWTRNAAFQGGAVYHLLEWQDPDNPGWSNVGVGDGSRTHTDLNDGDKYEYQVRATCTQDRRGSPSGWFNAYTSTTPTATAYLPPPTTATVTGTGRFDADITWTDNHDYGDTRIDYREPGGTWSEHGTVARNTESYTLDSLKEGNDYEARVVAQTEHTEAVDQ